MLFLKVWIHRNLHIDLQNLNFTKISILIICVLWTSRFTDSLCHKRIFNHSFTIISSPGNRHQNLPLDLSFHGNLSHLDLRFNSIPSLPQWQRDVIDSLVAGRPLELLLYGNPLSCQCSALGFVQWLGGTRAELDEGGNYTCLTEDGDMSTHSRLDNNCRCVVLMFVALCIHFCSLVCPFFSLKILFPLLF